MQYYLAPLEGITSYIYRRTYNKYFSPMDKYFTPFLVSPNFNMKEKMDLDPANNPDMELVPQILTQHADEFVAIAKSCSEYGYKTVNLNLGCPAGTVVSKRRGSGMLFDTDQLDRFLYEIFDKCPLSISVKTRIGISDLEEWEEILEVYKKYPMEELIIHPRLQKEFYTGTPHVDAYVKATECLDVSLCYNGDINTPDNLKTLLTASPETGKVMIGRGILKNPGLMAAIRGEAAPDKNTIRAFHDDLYEQYKERMSGEMPVLYKMIELWIYMQESFTNADKYLKKIKKAKHFSDYEIAAKALFNNEDYMGV